MEVYSVCLNSSSCGIKNAPFDVYVRHKVDEQNGMKVTFKENVTIDNERAVRILGDGINSFIGFKFVQYWYVMTINHMP
jgi:hypothetical protein